MSGLAERSSSSAGATCGGPAARPARTNCFALSQPEATIRMVASVASRVFTNERSGVDGVSRGTCAPSARILAGAQESQVLAWVGAAPIVYGTVAAVVRRRVRRRLVTWGEPVVARRIYAPLAYAPRELLVEA